jgi:hypothetical protein
MPVKRKLSGAIFQRQLLFDRDARGLHAGLGAHKAPYPTASSRDRALRRNTVLAS